MDQGPLVIDQVDAGARFLALMDRAFPIKVAFWLKGSEEGAWDLYLASESINPDNFDLGYGEVFRLAGESPELNIDPYRVKVVGASNPVARAAIDIQGRSTAKDRATRYRGPQLGGVGIEEVYIYPPLKDPVAGRSGRPGDRGPHPLPAAP